MSFFIKILTQANEDLLAANKFYEEQQQGLGKRCINSLLNDIAGLAHTAGVHPKRYGFYFKIATAFPFGIYYDISDSTVRVFAVLDNRQAIEKIMDKLLGVKNA
jgi:plasmid stabilization system protein ParE